MGTRVRHAHDEHPHLGFPARLGGAARALYRFAVELDRHRTLGLGAESAFWVVLSMLPLAAMAGFVAARLAVTNWQILAPLAESLPPPTRALIGGEIERLSAWDGRTVGATGTLVFVWLASNGVQGLLDAIELESGGSRPWWKKRLIAIGACVVASIVVAVLGFMGPGLEALFRVVADVFHGYVPGWATTLGARIVRAAIAAALWLALVSGLYAIGVPRSVGLRMPIVPGAALAALLQMIFAFGYAFYLGTVGDGGAYQAGLATIGVTMTAVWLACTAVLTGAVLNRMIGVRRGTLVTGESPRR